MSIFVNRILNLKKIEAIGFDMDYTLVRYQTERFEELTYTVVLDKLVGIGYPKEIQKMKFDFNRAIRGLVLDEKLGNILKISLYGRIKQAYHGLKEMEYKQINELYSGQVIDLRDPRFTPIDTAFSIAHAVLFAQIVDLKDKTPDVYPEFEKIAKDIITQIDIAHRDNSLKQRVLDSLEDYIIQDPEIVWACENLKASGKRLFVATNSDYEYTQKLLDYTFNPYLKDHKHWRELFDLTITLSSKPLFFTGNQKFLELDDETQHLKNIEKLQQGKIYQGGNAITLMNYFDLSGEQILYLGDHIYGDILALKKECNWRTALVLEEITNEIECTKKGQSQINEIDQKMIEKENVEDQIDKLYKNREKNKKEIDSLFDKIREIDDDLEKLISKYNENFNPYWGEVMRAGVEESRLAGQVAKYACIYMAKVSDLFACSPRKYFRPGRRTLPHDFQ